jgi:hypothetical protein
MSPQEAFVRSVVTQLEEYPKRPTAADFDFQINYEFANDTCRDGFI